MDGSDREIRPTNNRRLASDNEATAVHRPAPKEGAPTSRLFTPSSAAKASAVPSTHRAGNGLSPGARCRSEAATYTGHHLPSPGLGTSTGASGGVPGVEEEARRNTIRTGFFAATSFPEVTGGILTKAGLRGVWARSFQADQLSELNGWYLGLEHH